MGGPTWSKRALTVEESPASASRLLVIAAITVKGGSARYRRRLT